ncbi:bacteriorhodopsin [Larsenimonas salina]|uniref:bacteriorhodopsin n=1 Tax=Larsenimonas salina TaxID=1295565 RepID=UPI002072B033|nr:bacteriorhodopsin [Larsenimonas salina]MCM5705184.1 bacteriorhodopsin [Larsenimonas salina]
MSSAVQFPLVIGWIAMLAGGIAFWRMSKGLPENQKHHGIAAMTIVFVAFANYLAMALGQGDMIHNGRDVFFARYIDWVITTPILLVSLAMVASKTLAPIRTLVCALIAADIYMIVTGLVGNLSESPYNYLWWLVSMVAFLVVLALIWGPLQKVAGQGAYRSEFSTLSLMLTVLWCCYPIVWLLGTSGAGLFSAAVESWFYLILDVTAKVGFGFVALNAVRKRS